MSDRAEIDALRAAIIAMGKMLPGFCGVSPAGFYANLRERVEGSTEGEARAAAAALLDSIDGGKPTFKLPQKGI
jgi:hypothetical protein